MLKETFVSGLIDGVGIGLGMGAVLIASRMISEFMRGFFEKDDNQND